MKKYSIFFICLLITTIAQATPIYPCSTSTKNFSFKNKQLLLTGNSQRFYLLANKNQQTIIMDIAIHNGTTQAGWASQIEPGHYSIISMDKPQFAFRCNASNQDNQFYTLDCYKVLSVCQLQTTPQRDNKPAPAGSGWVFENLKF